MSAGNVQLQLAQSYDVERARMKISIIGAGSSYTPTIVSACVDRGLLGLSDSIWLMDVNQRRVDDVSTFIRVAQGQKRPGCVRVRETTDLAEALDGAAFVLLLYSAGGLESRKQDEEICRRHGVIAQETVGVGGFASALRNLPLWVQIMELAPVACPDAWLIILTNPTGFMAEVASIYGGIHFLGLCEIAWRVRRVCAMILDASPDTVALDYVGLNHLGWVRRVLLDDVDVTGRLLGRVSEVLDEIVKPNLPDLFDRRFVQELGMIPSPYLQFYYAQDAILADQLSNPQTPTRADSCLVLDSALQEAYRNLEFGRAGRLIARRGGTGDLGQAVAALMESLLSDKAGCHIAITPGRGSVPGMLDEKAVVEVPAEVSRQGVFPHQVKGLEPHLHGLMSVVKAYERLLAEAALEGSYSKAVRALATHPLIPSARVARGLLDDVLAAYGAHLLS
jgi:6-phospho-beta-glucosidase